MSNHDLAKNLGTLLKRKKWKVSTAESCTGGGIAYAITSVSGSSEWFHRGYICYSDHSKIEMLDVLQHTIDTSGVVSKEVVEEMTYGVVSCEESHLVVAVSGMAEPSEGDIWISWKHVDKDPITEKFNLVGDREQVRTQIISIALQGLIEMCG